MLKKLGSLGIVAALLLIPLLAMAGLSLASSEVDMAYDIGIQKLTLEASDYSAVPQSVIDDAVQLANEVIDDNEETAQVFVDQLVATYVEAAKQDIVIIFNSGGMGWNMTEETPGWESILDGITSQLNDLGYKSIVMNYRRTGSSLMDSIREFFEAARRYPNKAQDLAVRVEFLTDHLPDLKIIVAGESTGTVITDKTMLLLQDKPQIFSIQTGMPFWHKQSTLNERTLLVNSNGRGEDTFSYGNIPAMLWATVKSWFGMTKPDDNPGDVLKWLKAPGHDYSWQYPGVYEQVIQFLQSNFGQDK
ncbi:MAG: hypothetical protein MUO19_00800 [Dehalococcoidales bacterium]|nr:hypothetical protein [Dehalococcoidales bacterium]